MDSSGADLMPSPRSARRRVRRFAAIAAVVALAFGPATAAAAAPAALTFGQRPARPLAAAASPAKINDPVIVVMKSQPAATRPGTRASAVRSAAIAAAQAPLLRELRAAHARHVNSYRLVNAFAATVSAAQAASLRSSPGVAEVLPDTMVRDASPVTGDGARAPARQPSAPASAGLTPRVIPGACGAHGSALLDPEALATTQTASQTPGAKTARSLGMTGAGVKVAFIADGLNPRNVNFIRADGRSVFDRAFGGDYEDFSGDGPGQLTGGAEAFLDANSIAGQGIHVYNVRTFSAQHDPTACNIKIEGTAPGAQLVGLDVFGSFEFTLESNFLEAISYAVETDHVNVINESFGSNPFPDSAALNVLKLFNDAAVAAGTTVTVASGDSGSTNTIASPASDPKLISVGASTTFRFYAQTNFAAARYFATAGWLNDNVSSISSGGFTASGGTVSLVAPGDAGFASCSTNVSVYAECSNLSFDPSPVELAGGTSEAAPLTAGAAALVIQAYRQSHHGATPSPVLVKQILTSTASNLGLPATEQGSGLLNTYKAVLLAESIKTAAASPQPAGDTLLISRSQLTAAGRAGRTRTWQVRVTNTGADGQLVKASGRTFGPDVNVQTGKVKLVDGKSAQFTDFEGLPNNYAEFRFTVKPGAKRIDSSIAYQSPDPANLFTAARLILVDPRGRFAADSVPQGAGNFGNVDVRAPVPGVWTGVVMGVTGADTGTQGTILWRVASQRLVPFGTVSPSAFFLRPGQTGTLKFTARLPGQASDASGAVIISSSLGGSDRDLGAESESIPVTLRTMADPATGGAFSGVLTGGNGRSAATGQVDYVEFPVGEGHRGITANVTLAGDRNDIVGSYLIAPDGQALGFGQNSANGFNSRSLTAYTADPAPGIWTLAIDFNGPVVGDALSQPFSGTITLDTARATAIGLPDSPRRLFKRKVPVVVKLKITNTGPAPEDYFADPRLARTRTFDLESLTGDTFGLPLTAAQPQWVVPTHASSARVTAKATNPVEFDWGPVQADPDLFGQPVSGNRAVGSFTPAGGMLQPGLWIAGPVEMGPYPHGAPFGGSVTMTMKVTARAFDSALTPSTGDLWRASVQFFAPFQPLTIGPGKTRTIKIVLRPNGTPGTVVRGTLYVDDFVSALPPGDQPEGDELVAIPYAYKIK